MALRTRLDCRSEKNKYIKIFDRDGELLLTITACSTKVELAIEPAQDITIEKQNGRWGTTNE